MAPQQGDMVKIAASGRSMTAPSTVPASSPAVRDRLVEALDLDLVGPGPGDPLAAERVPGREVVEVVDG